MPVEKIKLFFWDTIELCTKDQQGAWKRYGLDFIFKLPCQPKPWLWSALLFCSTIKPPCALVDFMKGNDSNILGIIMFLFSINKQINQLK